MDDYEEQLENERKKNDKYLKEFQKWLENKGLKDKTIMNHVSNMDFYLNDYLNYYEITPMEEGIYDAYSFLSDWFIRKCLYASKTSIKENATSIKKFYQCMSEAGIVSVEDYKSLEKDLKDNMDDFLENLEDYDNGTYLDMF